MSAVESAKLDEKQNRMNTFRERIRILRHNRSQAEFAQLIGCTRITIGNYENGDRLPDALTIHNICQKCDVTSDWLLGLSDVAVPETDAAAASKKFGLTGEALGKLESYFNVTPRIVFAISSLLADDEFYITMKRVTDASESLIKAQERRSDKLITERETEYLRDFTRWRIDTEIHNYFTSRINDDGSLKPVLRVPGDAKYIKVEMPLPAGFVDELEFRRAYFEKLFGDNAEEAMAQADAEDSRRFPQEKPLKQARTGQKKKK
jgi:transcriptional regulator with XRE-family HTH domain